MQKLTTVYKYLFEKLYVAKIIFMHINKIITNFAKVYYSYLQFMTNCKRNTIN